MRKIIAVLLTVLMLASVLAALPASAATFDGSTKTDSPALFISEVASYTQYFAFKGADGSNSHALDYMEIYNNGTDSVNLSTLSILRAVDFPSKRAPDESPYAKFDPYDGIAYDTFWTRYQKFIAKVDIKADKIIADKDALQYGKFNDSDSNSANGIQGDEVYNFLTNNGVNMTLESGKAAIVWFISEATIDWMKAQAEIDLQFNPRNAFLKSFYPDMPATDYANYQIVMVWGWGDTYIYDDNVAAKLNGNPAYDMFSLASMPAYNETAYSYLFAIAKNTFQIFDDKAYDTNGLNDKIYSLTRFGAVLDEDAILLNGYSGSKSSTAATFTAANVKPYVSNAEAKFLDDTAAQATDYYAAGQVGSYFETGVITWNGADVTPGQLPVWQWAMVNPGHANAPEDLKTSGVADATKVQAVIDAYIERLGFVDDGSGNRNEADRPPIEFESQESIANRFNNANKKQEVEKSFFEQYGLIIIIAAVVVVLGAAAVVVFVVILPKKKKAAAAAAVAEEAAPAEEAPVEAPAEETQE